MRADQLDPASLQILRDALGIRSDGKRRGYRNSYATSTGSSSHQLCVQLVAAGLMIEKTRDGETKPDQIVFSATESGRAAMAAMSPDRRKFIQSTWGSSQS